MLQRIKQFLNIKLFLKPYPTKEMNEDYKIFKDKYKEDHIILYTDWLIFFLLTAFPSWIIELVIIFNNGEHKNTNGMKRIFVTLGVFVFNVLMPRLLVKILKNRVSSKKVFFAILDGYSAIVILSTFSYLFDVWIKPGKSIDTLPATHFSLYLSSLYVILINICLLQTFSNQILKIPIVLLEFLANFIIILKFSNLNTLESIQILIFLIMTHLWMISMISLQEKNIQIIFEKQREVEITKNNFETLLNEMNRSIIVINEQKQVTYNNEDSKKTIFEDKEISLESIVSEFNNIYPNFDNVVNEKSIILEKNLNLREIYDNFCTDKNVNYETVFSKTFKNLENTKEEEENNNLIESYYQIKLKKIVFDKQNSIMVKIENVSSLARSIKENDEFRNRMLKVVASFSHNLRTPLNGSLAPLESCIADESVPEEFKEKYLKYSFSSLLLLKSFLNDVVDFSLLITDKFVKNIDGFSLHDLSDEILNIFALISKSKNICIKSELDENIPHIVYSDSQRIKQVK